MLNGGGETRSGGAINITNGAIVTINGSTFVNNEAGRVGGAIAVLESTVTLNNTNLVIIERLPQQGRLVEVVLCIYLVQEHIKNATSTSNSAEDSGGAISSKNASSDNDKTFLIQGSQITGNRGRKGGGVHFDGGGQRSLTIADSSVSTNTVTFDGGGVRLVNAILATVSDSTISGNIAGSNYNGDGEY